MDQSSEAYYQLQSEAENLLISIDRLTDKVTSDRDGIAKNVELLQSATTHANELEARANELKDEVDRAKSPATRTIEAATAYGNIVEAIRNATDSANKALEAAQAASQMVNPLISMNRK